MSFADKVKKLVEEAPVVSGGGPNINFGPATFTPIIVDWSQKDSEGHPLKTTLADFMEENGLKEDDDIELDPRNQKFALSIDIDVSALNPSLAFHYERDIVIQESSRDPKDPSKSRLTSWTEIVHPSIEAVFGKNWYKKILPNGSGEAPVFYVSAENVDAVETVKEGKKKLTVPKFLATYKDLDACRKARDERYPPRDDAQAMAFPGDGEEEEGDEEGYPEDVLEQVRDLYKSCRKNSKQTLKMMEASGDFEDYDLKELLAAAVGE